MTPAHLAARLRELERLRTSGSRDVATANIKEAELVTEHADLFPFTHRGVTFEAWKTRAGRPYVRITRLKGVGK